MTTSKNKYVSTKTGSAVSVRDRILDTAANLFYQEGVRAIGVDLVVERSGVAKTSLYRHFATKDDLVVAILKRDDADYWRYWDQIATAEKNSNAHTQLEAHLKWISHYINRPEYRGCPFLNVATEFPGTDQPARKVSIMHKAELRKRLCSLTKRLGARKHTVLADQLILLIDGAYVNGQLQGKLGPSNALVSAALALIAVATEKPI
jgi:AcrR family transcriptional regulator